MIERGLGLIAAVLLVPPAAAQGRCALSAPLCADPEIRQLDAERLALEARVAVATRRPANWKALSADFARWLADPARAHEAWRDTGDINRREELRTRNHYLGEILDQAAGIVAPASAAEILSDKCLFGWFSQSCHVEATGRYNPEDGPRLAWQLARGANPNGEGMVLMLWDVSDPGAPVSVGWDYRFSGEPQAPRWIRDDEVLQLGDFAFRKRGGKWIDLDSTSWWEAASMALPADLLIDGRFEYLFTGPGVRMPLRRRTDPLCCPTGGIADFRLSLDGDIYVFEDLEIRRPGAAEPIRLP